MMSPRYDDGIVKRWALRIFVLLLLLGGGAIVNVAVAWGCAIWSPRPACFTAPVDDRDREHLWRRWSEPEWSRPISDEADPRPFLETAGWGVRLRGEFGRGLRDQRVGLTEVTAGWPVFATSGAACARESGDIWVKYAIRIENHSQGALFHILPIAPIWPGFAINTVFYAAVLWMLFAFPFALRKRRRIQRGLCPKCAYDLRGNDSTQCPECGAPR